MKYEEIISDNRAEFDEYRKNEEKIQAIKSLRVLSGCSLKESKAEMDIFFSKEHKGGEPLVSTFDKCILSEILNKVRNRLNDSEITTLESIIDS